jgi:formate C-acetyltransferase
LATNGTLLNLKLQADTIAGEEGLQRLCNFIRAFCSLKLNHIQFNTVSAETLRKAQANPHEYRNLLVRVAGYSAFFVEINRDLQDDIIDRTEHAL